MVGAQVRSGRVPVVTATVAVLLLLSIAASRPVAAQPTVVDNDRLFTDVPPGHTFADQIAWLATSGITHGRGDGSFGVNDSVTRGAMAAFLYRYAGQPDGPFDASTFSDVPSGHTFAREIAWLASTGISLGRADGSFGVNDAVTRGAMAAFLYRFAGEPAGQFDAPTFHDVPPGHTFASEIAWLASTGITQGRGDGSFGVNDPVTRGAMAAFLHRFEAWQTPGPFRLHARAGVGEQAVVELLSAELAGIARPRDVEVVVDGEIGTLVEALGVDWAGARGRVVPVILEMRASDGSPAQVEGSIEVRSADGSVLGLARAGVVEVQQLGPGVVPDRPADPQPDELEELAGGQLVVSGEVVVELDAPADGHVQVLDRLAGQIDGVVVGGVPALGLYQLRVDGADAAEVSVLADQLAADAQVRFAGLHPVAAAELQTIPNDPWRSPWWNLSPISWDTGSPEAPNWGMEALRLPEAWSLSTGSPDVAVAVIDVGFYDGHSDLRANITQVRGHAGAGNHYHGTHVAGTVCAVGNNGVGVTGVAWQCDLRLYNMAPRIDDPLLGLIDDDAEGDERRQQELVVSSIRAAEAMLWAVEDGARIVNLSLGFVENFRRCVDVSDRSQDVTNTINAYLSVPIRQAIEDGADVLWVFAAGNECRDARYQSPASLTAEFPDNTLSVAATTPTGSLASFSNRGSLVDVAAPGTDILSTGNRSCAVDQDCSETYTTLNGTSMAAPHVTGTAALMLDVNPALRAADVRRCLIDSSTSQPVPGHDFGIIDAHAAVQCVIGTSGRLAAGWIHTCALRADGTVACWGGNWNGQLGDGTTTDRLTPVGVVGLDDAVQVTAGWHRACVLRANMGVSCWGGNAGGQLGDGTTTDRLTPVRVVGLDDAVELAAGMDHTCAVRADGSTACWGWNGDGQLGDGTTTGRLTPVGVVGLYDAVELAAGRRHTCALRADRRVACWGRNSEGQLGDGTRTERVTPVGVVGLDDAVQLAAGWDHTCALRADRGVACWGSNEWGQLGDGTATDRLTPVGVVGLDDAVQLTAGYGYTCALRADRGVACWGSNEWGQLGDGTATDRFMPVGVVGLDDAVELAAGLDHTCALRAGGSVACWGINWGGQLGDGTTTDRLTPVGVVGLG